MCKPFCQQTMENPFMTKGRRSSAEDRQSTVLIVTPLSVLIHDQIGKMKGCGGKVYILKGDACAVTAAVVMRVFHWRRPTSGPRNNNPVENSKNSKLIYALVFITIVVGEAHLGNDG